MSAQSALRAIENLGSDGSQGDGVRRALMEMLSFVQASHAAQQRENTSNGRKIDQVVVEVDTMFKESDQRITDEVGALDERFGSLLSSLSSRVSSLEKRFDAIETGSQKRVTDTVGSQIDSIAAGFHARLDDVLSAMDSLESRVQKDIADVATAAAGTVDQTAARVQRLCDAATTKASEAAGLVSRLDERCSTAMRRASEALAAAEAVAMVTERVDLAESKVASAASSAAEAASVANEAKRAAAAARDAAQKASSASVAHAKGSSALFTNGPLGGGSSSLAAAYGSTEGSASQSGGGGSGGPLTAALVARKLDELTAQQDASARAVRLVEDLVARQDRATAGRLSEFDERLCAREAAMQDVELAVRTASHTIADVRAAVHSVERVVADVETSHANDMSVINTRVDSIGAEMHEMRANVERRAFADEVERVTSELTGESGRMRAALNLAETNIARDIHTLRTGLDGARQGVSELRGSVQTIRLANEDVLHRVDTHCATKITAATQRLAVRIDQLEASAPDATAEVASVRASVQEVAAAVAASREADRDRVDRQVTDFATEWREKASEVARAVMADANSTLHSVKERIGSLEGELRSLRTTGVGSGGAGGGGGGGPSALGGSSGGEGSNGSHVPASAVGGADDGHSASARTLVEMAREVAALREDVDDWRKHAESQKKWITDRHSDRHRVRALEQWKEEFSTNDSSRYDGIYERLHEDLSRVMGVSKKSIEQAASLRDIVSLRKDLSAEVKRLDSAFDGLQDRHATTSDELRDAIRALDAQVAKRSLDLEGKLADKERSILTVVAAHANAGEERTAALAARVKDLPLMSVFNKTGMSYGGGDDGGFGSRGGDSGGSRRRPAARAEHSDGEEGGSVLGSPVRGRPWEEAVSSLNASVAMLQTSLASTSAKADAAATAAAEASSAAAIVPSLQEALSDTAASVSALRARVEALQTSTGGASVSRKELGAIEDAISSLRADAAARIRSAEQAIVELRTVAQKGGLAGPGAAADALHPRLEQLERETTKVKTTLTSLRSDTERGAAERIALTERIEARAHACDERSMLLKREMVESVRRLDDRIDRSGMSGGTDPRVESAVKAALSEAMREIASVRQEIGREATEPMMRLRQHMDDVFDRVMRDTAERVSELRNELAQNPLARAQAQVTELVDAAVRAAVAEVKLELDAMKEGVSRDLSDRITQLQEGPLRTAVGRVARAAAEDCARIREEIANVHDELSERLRRAAGGA